MYHDPIVVARVRFGVGLKLGGEAGRCRTFLGGCLKRQTAKAEPAPRSGGVCPVLDRELLRVMSHALDALRESGV